MKQNYECGRLIKHINDELEKQANNTLSSQNLTLAQMRVLMELKSAEDNQLSLKELELLLHVAQSTAAGIVVRLEQKGYVKSFTDANDRRVKKVSVTPSGLECCKNAQFHIDDMENQLLQSLTPDEKEQFYNLLQKICR